MIDFNCIPVKKDHGDSVCNKENAQIIKAFFLEELGYSAFFDAENPLTAAYLIRKYRLQEDINWNAHLSTKERKASPQGGWKLIDLIIYRLNSEFKTRLSEKDRAYFAAELRHLVATDQLLNGLREHDYHMLYALANSGTSFSIKFASLFCRILCKFHPELEDTYSDCFVVTDYKRLSKFSKNPQEDLANNAYMQYCKYLDGFIGMCNGALPPEQRLNLSEEWLLDIYLENQ